jgi:hypothetical protein
LNSPLIVLAAGRRIDRFLRRVGVIRHDQVGLAGGSRQIADERAAFLDPDDDMLRPRAEDLAAPVGKASSSEVGRAKATSS